MICKEHDKITYLTFCLRCIIEIKQEAKKEVFDDIETNIMRFRGDYRKNFTRNDFEKLKTKHLVRKE